MSRFLTQKEDETYLNEIENKNKCKYFEEEKR